METWNNRLYEKPPINLMNFIQLYLTFSFVFYFIGPVKWNTQNVVLLIVLVVSYQIMFKFGYDFQIKKPTHPARNAVGEKHFWVKHFYFISIVSIFLNVLILIRITYLYGISSIFETMVLSITNPTSLYHANVSTNNSALMFGGTLLANINALASPITFAVIPVGLVVYRELSKSKRILFWISAITNVVLSISTGRSEGILRIAVFLMTWFLLRKNRTEKARGKGSQRVIIIRVLGVVIVLIAFLFLYSLLMENRTLGSYGLPIGNNYIDYNNFLFKILPTSVVNLMVYLNIYLTQGYFGMSISISKIWQPTFFCGFSSWFRNEVEGVLNVDIKSRTFMAQATDYGWKYGTNWHTAYTWFACDVWWLGVLFIMFFMGRLLAAVYKDAYYNQSPLAIGLMSMMILFAIYLPANNYLFSDSDTFISFFIFLVLWGVKFKIGNKPRRRIT